MTAAPILFQWMGDSFIPADDKQARRADETYVVGECYRLTEPEDRSDITHHHFFAAVKEAWTQLPEHHDRFPSPEHLRRYALIKAGFYNSHSIVCASEESARDVAARMKPVDEFGVIDVHGLIVTRYAAKSQSYRAMEKDVFQASKSAVLDVIASMIDVPRRDLERNAGKAA